MSLLTTPNAQQSDCRVFALIIGIDHYKTINGLNGCVNDAKAFKTFLTGSLHVPDSHIELIVNKDATRLNIISKFRSHLIGNPDIRDVSENSAARTGDTIIFFYAGHGSRVPAPNNQYASDGLVETICPHDEGHKDSEGEHIHGIPDYTIHSLLQKLAAAKGNNVTAIFDSCNSGGIARKDDELVSRFAEIKVPIPIDLDRELVPRGAHATLPKGFRFQFMESHILLAACRQEQMSFETIINGVRRGRFSERLIRNLQSISLEKTTYISLMDLLGNWTEQHPQLEGKNRDRLLFNGTYPPTSTRALPMKPINIQDKEEEKQQAFQIQMGSIEGVVVGTEFLANDASNNVVAFFSAWSVELDHSIIVTKDKKAVLPKDPSGWKATVSDWKNDQMVMRIFIASNFDSTVASAVFPDRHLDTTQLKSLPTPRNFVQVDAQAKGDVELQRLSDDTFALERLTGTIQDHKIPATEFSMKPDRYARLPMIMDAIAHFHYFLHKAHGGTPISAVTLEMHTLTGTWPTRDVSDNIFVNNAVDVVWDKDARYGFTICNRSQYDLWPYMFYFDPAEYSIQTWYSPPAGPTMEPPLKASSDGIEPKRLPIGYGAGGFAFEFDLPEGKTVDTGFVKIFFATEYLDLEWIQQDSPFSSDVPRYGKREIIQKGKAWDGFHSAITVRFGVPVVS
ncbi:caspase domain-containing protein [Mycena crocata]|nr:caspase domain-containing protein [Mycena crocata]